MVLYRLRVTLPLVGVFRFAAAITTVVARIERVHPSLDTALLIELLGVEIRELVQFRAVAVVIEHDVDDHVDALGVGLVDHRAELGLGAELAIEGCAVVGLVAKRRVIGVLRAVIGMFLALICSGQDALLWRRDVNRTKPGVGDLGHAGFHLRPVGVEVL